MEENVLKITEAELQKCNELFSEYSKLTHEFGQLNMSEMLIQEQLENIRSVRKQLEQKYDELRTREKELTKSFEDIYGQGTLDIANGIFTKK